MYHIYNNVINAICIKTYNMNDTTTCVLSHVVLQLSCPLALVAAFWTKIFLLFLMDPHMKLWIQK